MRELLIPVLLIIVAFGFVYAGFQIAVRKRLDYITGYHKKKKLYINYRAFAIRHGLIDLFGGGAMLLCGVLCSFYKLEREAFVVVFCGTGIILILLKLNEMFSKKNW